MLVGRYECQGVQGQGLGLFRVHPHTIKYSVAIGHPNVQFRDMVNAFMPLGVGTVRVQSLEKNFFRIFNHTPSEGLRRKR